MSEQSDATTQMTGTTQDLARHMNDVNVIDHAAHTSWNATATIALNVLETQAYGNEDIATIVVQKTIH